MKNISLLTVLLLIAGWTTAQQSQIPKAPAALEQMAESAHTAQGIGPSSPATPAGGQTVIWAEDFGNGFPSNWTVDNPGGQCPWVWSNDGSWGFFNGNSGSAGGAAMNSTTAGNGFLICDPDSANNVNNGQPSGSNYVYYDSYFVTNAIDLSGFPSVNLEFEQTFRYNNALDLEVQVSNDSVNWETYLVQGNSTNNQQSDDPDFVSLNISQVAGDEATVWIKIGWSARVYYWMIDDMRITEAPDNDLAIEGVFYRGTDDTLYTQFYTEQPWRQAQQDSMIFGARIQNVGSAVQTNVQLSMDVQGPVPFAQTSPALASLNVLQEDSFEVAQAFYPAALGNYTINFSAMADSADAEPMNSEISESFEVTDTTYAREDGNYDGNGIWYGGGTTYEVGVGFDIYTQDTATSISVLFQGTTLAGSIVSINLYSDADLNTPIASSPFNNLTNAQIATWVSFDLPDTPLPPGYYVAGFSTFSDTVLMAVSATPKPTPPQSVFINVDNGGWFYTQQFTPMIRLNTKEFLNPCTAVPSAAINSVSCNGATDGSVNLSLSSGFAPVTYAWSHGPTTQDVSGMPGGDYTVTITDGIGCGYTYMATVPEPAPLVSATNAQDENCGAGDGVASVGLTGGTPPYFYIWNTTQTGSSIGNLSAGTYTVTFTDASGCFDTDQVTIGGSGALLATDMTTDASCGNSDGDATVNPTTGTAPYTYNWSSGDTTATATGLAAGGYMVTVTDSDGCASAIQVNVSNTGAPVLSAPTVTNVGCNGGSDGSIDLTVFGGAMPYSYDWTGGDTTQMITGIGAGTYNATVTDAANCLLVTSFTITEPDAIATNASGDSPSCNGASDATASVGVFGGTSPYSYEWSNNDSTAQASGLDAGQWMVTVTDANGCTAVDAVVILDPPVFNGSTNVVNVLCNGGNSGSAGITPNGGAMPYNYVWDGGELTDQIFGLSQGSYTVTVTDANGCTLEQTLNVSEPSALSSSNTVDDMAADYEGSIDLTVQGGTPGYNYTWTGPNGFTSLSQDLSGLTDKGWYYVTIRDDNNCVLQDSAEVGGNVSIAELNLLNGVRVMPNPNTGVFTVDFGSDATGSYAMSLRNMLGQEVYTEQVNANQRTRKQLTLTHLDKGIYFLTVTDGTSEVTRKVVLQ